MSRDHDLPRPDGLSYRALSALSDEAVMAHLAGGHGDAIAVLFDRYSRLVMSVALKIVREHAEAEDLTQDIFVELCRTAGQFDAALGTTKMWILRTAYRRSLNRRRDIKLRGNLVRRDFADLLEAAPATSLFQGLTTQETRRLVRQVLNSLDANQREVLELVHLEGMSLRDAAEQIGGGWESVRHRYYRGLKRLRELVRQDRQPVAPPEEALDARA